MNLSLPARDARYPLGVAMVLAAGVCLSFGGLILRHVQDADIWLVIFYRSLTFVATLLVFLGLRYRGGFAGAFRAVGWSAVPVALALGGGSVLYLFAIKLTTVANVMFVLSSAPLVTAVLAWYLLRERLRPATWMAILAALGGISIMVAGGLGSGRLPGNLAAFGAVLCFAAMVIAIRRARTLDMVPATCLGGLVAAAISAAMAGDFAISGHDLAMCLLLGSGQLGAGFLLITLGTRYLPAAEVPLLAMSEVVLAPLWVWLWVDEVPSGTTMLGGIVVLAAVFGQAASGLRRPATAVG
jgi:drug/metabolite transporter (DMT)-like permease